MKKLMLLLLCLLLVAGCESTTAWIMGNPESDGVIGARLGTEAQNAEVGISVYYNPYDSDEEAYGAYALYNLPINEISVYGGAQATIGKGTWDVDDTISPVAGFTIWDLIFVEWQNEAVDGEDDKFLAGLRFRF